MSFTHAWNLMLRGKRVRRRTWASGVYIYLSPKSQFIFLAGLSKAPPTHWKPYKNDFNGNNWEVV